MADQVQEAQQSAPASSMASPEMRELVRDAEFLAGVRHDGLNRAVNAMVGERTGLLKDTLNLAVPLLVGAITLYVLAPRLVKTPVVFFISLACLVLSIFMGLLIRMRLLTYLQQVVIETESSYTRVAEAARTVKGNTNEETVRELVQAESAPANLPNLRWFEDRGFRVVVGLLLVGLLGVGLSLLVNITV